MTRLPVLVGVSLVLGSALPAPTGAQAVPSPSVARSFEVHATGGLGGAVTRIGAFRIRRDPTIRAAQRVFGRPSSRRLGPSGTCTVEWRRLRLRILFENFGGRLPGQTTCTSTVGRAQSFTARGDRFRTWRGLSVGDSTDELVKLHPDAEFREGRWWLRFAVSPYGEAGEYPSLYATASRGDVNALKGWIGAAGE
jgi:hypothetical protein